MGSGCQPRISGSICCVHYLLPLASVDEVAEEPIMAKVGVGPLDYKRRVAMTGPQNEFSI